MKLSNCHSGFPTGAPGPLKMANPVREYDWGSTGALAALQGPEPSDYHASQLQDTCVTGGGAVPHCS